MPQLHSLGMLQTCEVLKVGMPTRVSYADVAALFRSRLPPAALRSGVPAGPRLSAMEKPAGAAPPAAAGPSPASPTAPPSHGRACH